MSAHFIFFLVSGLCYLAAFALSVLSLRRGRSHDGAGFFALLLAGFFSHSAALSFWFFRLGAAPFSTAHGLLESIAWLFALCGAAAAVILRVRLSGLFFMPAAAFFTLLPLCCPVFDSDAAQRHSSGFLLAAHAWLAMLSYALTLACAVFGAMDILQRRSLKLREGGALSRALLPLPLLERHLRLCLCLAAASMMASVISGLAACCGADMGARALLKYSAGGLVFAMQASLLLAVFFKSVAPARAAKLAVLLFAASLLLLIPIIFKQS